MQRGIAHRGYHHHSTEAINLNVDDENCTGHYRPRAHVFTYLRAARYVNVLGGTLRRGTRPTASSSCGRRRAHSAPAARAMPGVPATAGRPRWAAPAAWRSPPRPKGTAAATRSARRTCNIFVLRVSPAQRRPGRFFIEVYS